MSAARPVVSASEAQSEARAALAPSAPRASPALIEEGWLDPPPPPEPPPAAEAAALDERDLLVVLQAMIDEGPGLVGHHVDAYDRLVAEGLPRVITQIFRVDRDFANEGPEAPGAAPGGGRGAPTGFHLDLAFEAPVVARPATADYTTGLSLPLFPAEARLGHRSYAGQLSLEARVALTARYADGSEEVRAARVPRTPVALFPVAVGSALCHTQGLAPAALRAMREDPADPGGYFILGANAYVLEMGENVVYNEGRYHVGITEAERVRVEDVSQAGGAFENSSQVIVRLKARGQITCELNNPKTKKREFPFYLVFRALGMGGDAELAAHVLLDAPGAPVARRMGRLLYEAFVADYEGYGEVAASTDREAAVAALADRLETARAAARADAEGARYLNGSLLRILDENLLPHVGQGRESRVAKLRLLARMIGQMLLIELGVLPPTDRDALAQKRIHDPAVAYAKVFKAQFNAGFVRHAVARLKARARNTRFADVTEARLAADVAGAAAVARGALSRALEQAIVTNAESIEVGRRGRPVANRISSTSLPPENAPFVASVLRTVATHGVAKTGLHTARAKEMRRVHPTMAGYYCLVRSADTGPAVGLKKELALTARVCAEEDPALLRRALLADPAVVPLAAVPPADVGRRGLAPVFVGGAWVGCCASAPALAARYRRLRRAGRVVSPRASVVWRPQTNEVAFQTDVGRLTRPLLLVYNNQAAYDAACRAAARARRRGAAGWAARRVPFRQGVALAPAHVARLRAGAADLGDLWREGVVEWVAAEEAENCLVAPSLARLRARAGDVTRPYTHCEIPQALLGVSALVSPDADHTQPARVTYQTNHLRHAAGVYAGNWPFDARKGAFLAAAVERPLVRTLADAYLPPVGVNARVAYAFAEGFNQEDAVVWSRRAADAGALGGLYFRVFDARLEGDQLFGDPDPAATRGLRPGVSYEKLRDGFARPGATVGRGDALIGRFTRLRPGPEGGALFEDASVVYREDEPARVVAAYELRDGADKRVGVVRLASYRPLGVGSKTSSRAGNKGVCGLLLPVEDLPFAEGGETPDVVVSPLSIPSRMLGGQMLEALRGLAAAHAGAPDDATAFCTLDFDALRRRLAAAGLRANGTARMFNGHSGEHLERSVLFAWVFSYLVKKFSVDELYTSEAVVPTLAHTGQPRGGRGAGGAHRIGEMEVWAFAAHGMMGFLGEKLHVDSNGRTVYVCRRCQRRGVFNRRHGLYGCGRCGELADLVGVQTTKSAMLLHDELRSCGVDVLLKTRPVERFEYLPRAE